MRLLLVEDEQELRAQLAEQLRSRGFQVDEAGDGELGLFFGKDCEPDMAIIDLGLPKLPGMDVIRQLRMAGKDFPILILTARGNWRDKVEGLEAGADDYLVKPFHPEELHARVDALIRRSAGFASPEMHCGDLVLDKKTQNVTLADKPIDLTAYEYRVLEYMILRIGQVVTKTELTEHVYEQDFERDSNTVEVFVGRLRKKLDPDGTLKPIETLRGRGYRLNPVTCAD